VVGWLRGCVVDLKVVCECVVDDWAFDSKDGRVTLSLSVSLSPATHTHCTRSPTPHTTHAKAIQPASHAPGLCTALRGFAVGQSGDWVRGNTRSNQQMASRPSPGSLGSTCCLMRGGWVGVSVAGVGVLGLGG